MHGRFTALPSDTLGHFWLESFLVLRGTRHETIAVGVRSRRALWLPARGTRHGSRYRPRFGLLRTGARTTAVQGDRRLEPRPLDQHRRLGIPHPRLSERVA